VTTLARPLRSDAERNRVRILDAAADVLAQEGLDAPVEEIARRAGVGIGTVYRRFPTKEALVAAVADSLVDAVRTIAADALDAAPGEGFEQFLRGVAGLSSRYGRGLGRFYADDTARHRLRTEVDPIVERLLTEAKDRGRLRDDITRTDIGMLVWSVTGVVETTLDVAPLLWQRLLDVLVAGLRPGTTRLGHPPLTKAQADRITASRR
jgi:AcrR family transcriptional regulator